MNDIPDALRIVTAKMQKAIDAGRHGRFVVNTARRAVLTSSSGHVTTEQALCEGRSRHIDAEDLIEVLLTVADDIDPPLDGVAPALACPTCQEADPNRLV